MKHIISKLLLLTSLGFSMSFTVNPSYHGVNLIHASGRMSIYDLDRLKAKYRALSKYKQTILVLNSSGGELRAGIAIGKYLKKHHIGAAVKKYGTCASSCALAFLGGRALDGSKLQILPLGSKLGFHAFYYKNRTFVAPSQVQQDFSKLLSYTNYVNAPKTLVSKMLGTDAYNLYWINNHDRRNYNFISSYRNISFRIHTKYATNSSYDNQNDLAYSSYLNQTGYVRYYFSKINTYISSNKSAYYASNVALNDITHKDWLSENLNYVFVKRIMQKRNNKVEAKVIYSLKNGLTICSYNNYNLYQTGHGWAISNKTYRGCDHKSRKILRNYAYLLP